MWRPFSAEIAITIIIALCRGIQGHYYNHDALRSGGSDERRPYGGYIFAQWTSCIGATSCTQGIRHRRYSGPGFRHKLQFELCSAVCAVDGGYSEWLTWSSCSTSCGEGVKSRRRFCVDPLTDNLGQACGNGTVHEEFAECQIRECDPSVYSEWTEYFSCSATCGFGTRTRNRICLDRNRDNCVQGTVETDTPVPCKDRDCVDGGYTDWASWSICSASCDEATRRRERYCIDPIPDGGAMCTNGPVDTETEDCPYISCTSTTSSTTTTAPTTSTTTPVQTTTTTSPIPTTTPTCTFNDSVVPKDSCLYRRFEGQCLLAIYELRNQTFLEAKAFCSLLGTAVPGAFAYTLSFLQTVYTDCPPVSAFIDIAGACFLLSADTRDGTYDFSPCSDMADFETVTICI